jgi:hypothetical protein
MGGRSRAFFLGHQDRVSSSIFYNFPDKELKVEVFKAHLHKADSKSQYISST